MRRERPTLFKRRHFEAEIIVLCVHWYLRYPLSGCLECKRSRVQISAAQKKFKDLQAQAF